MVKPIGGTFEDVVSEVGEALVQPVRDEVGQAIEAGLKAVAGAKPPAPPQQAFDSSSTPLTPGNQDQQKKLQEQNLFETRRKIKWWKDLDEAQKKVREEEKQKLLQIKQEEEQKKQEKKQIKQFEIVKKAEEVNPALKYKGKAELKGGVGG